MYHMDEKFKFLMHKLWFGGGGEVISHWRKEALLPHRVLLKPMKMIRRILMLWDFSIVVITLK